MILSSLLSELASYVREYKAAEADAQRWYQAYLAERKDHAITRQDLLDACDSWDESDLFEDFI